MDYNYKDVDIKIGIRFPLKKLKIPESYILEKKKAGVDILDFDKVLEMFLQEDLVKRFENVFDGIFSIDDYSYETIDFEKEEN